MNILTGLNPQALAVKALATVLLAAALFGAGYFVAVRQYDRAAAQAAQAASVAAAQAQAKKDAADLKAAQADMAARSTANQKAAAVLTRIIHDAPTAVPTAPACKIPLEAMHALNDPSLIGDAP